MVRARRPASVRPGATALVLGDGTIEGFVGGHCAEPSVRMHALRALETGEALLLRIEPGNGEADAIDGAVTVHNPCISGGALEIFLEPHVPARACTSSATRRSRWRCASWRATSATTWRRTPAASSGLRATTPPSWSPRTGATRSARWQTALTAGVPYVGLVASRKRGAAVAAEPRRARGRPRRLHTPAGLDIGARTPEEIALSILAEIVSARRR